MTTMHRRLLPTHDMVRTFRSDLSSSSNCSYSVEELISEVCDALQYRDPTHLTILADKAYDHYTRYEGGITAEVISKAMMVLGTSLHRLYENLNMWNNEGRCDYYFKELLGDFIILEQYPF